MKKALSIIGARPQFIKHAPLQKQLQKYYHSLTLHTGQHYDEKMSEIFFEQLDISKPDYIFDIGSISFQGEQTAVMLINIEQVCLKEKPDFIILYGDTNSTLAGALAAVKIKIPVIHIEAGLRSYNQNMPEEINRIVADRFAEILFSPSQMAVENLRKEGIYKNVYKTGDIMCDSLHMVMTKIKRPCDCPYYFATIHRPYNTDTNERLTQIFTVLNKLGQKIVFPIHPRTKAKTDIDNIKLEEFNNITFIDPLGYIESLSFQKYADCIITDSGGIQKEAYMLKKKCITLRSETEWVETLENQWNHLVFEDLNLINEYIQVKPGEHNSQLYGNGKAAIEIVDILRQYF